MLVRDLYQKVSEVLGRCSQAVIFDRLTEVIEVLAAKGAWDPLVGYVDICGGTDCRTFTLPNDIETPLAVNICGRPAYFRSKWAEFHLNGAGSNRETPWTWDDVGFVPVIQDILTPSILVALADLKNDLSSVIQVFGRDSQGRNIRTQNPDGSWSDGFYVMPNVIEDFPNGVIQPNPYRPFYRIFTAKPVTAFDSATPHDFQSGVLVALSLITGPLPTPLKTGQSYYLGVLSDTSIALYLQRTDAIAGTNPIQIQDFAPSTVINLLDRRKVQTQTKFNSATALNFIDGSLVSFVGAPLPLPITANEQFYLHLLDANDFTIHGTAQDAVAGANPLFVTTPGAGVTAKASQPVTPYTKLTFTVPHNFLQNDAVTVANASGNLPNPLLPETTYYVRYLSSTEITLHTTLADAAIGTNAIILTDAGTGVSSVVKLIASTANVGSVNNINAPNHGLNPAGGDFVQFQSSGTLPSPLLPGTVYRAEPPNSTNTFTVASTSVSYVTTTTRRRSSNTALVETASPHGFITGDKIDISGMGGSGYNQVQATVTVVGASAFTYADVGTDEGVVATSSRRRSNQIAVLVTSAPHGLTTGQYANIQNLSGSNYNADYAQVTVIDANTFWYADLGTNDVGVATTNRARTANVSQLTTVSPHGLSNGQKVTIGNMTDPTFNNVNATITVVDPTNFSYSNSGSNVGSTADTNGYVAFPQVDTSGAVARGIADTGGSLANNRVNLTDVGTGVLSTVISRAFTIGFYDQWFLNAKNITTGTSFHVNSSGVITATNPALSPLTTYYARKIDDFTIEFFESSAKASDLVVRAASNYARTTNVSTIITAAAHGFASVDAVDITLMPDVSFNAQRAIVTVVNPTTFTYPNNGPDVVPTVTTTGKIVFSPIKIVAVGQGETDLILQAAVTAQLLSGLLEVDSASYILDETPYKFTTDGALPAPLVVGTTYHLSVINGLMEILDATNVPIILTNIGSGNHFITRDFNFTVEIPTSVQVTNNEYNTGDAVQVQNTGGVTPTPLVNNTTYYTRRIDDENVELYDTQLNAIGGDITNPSNGLIVVLNSGSGLNQLYQSLPAVQVLFVDRVVIIPGQTPSQALSPVRTAPGLVAAPLRNGFIDLYAWDYARKTDLTLLGHYSPKEDQPQYRRLKIECTSAWIRMRYRRKTFKITSLDDYIPLNSQLAILMMVRSVELYRTNYNDEAQKYEGLAVRWMTEDHDSRQGPEVASVQFITDIQMNTNDFLI